MCSAARKALMAATFSLGLSIAGLILVSAHGHSMLRLVHDHVTWASAMLEDAQQRRKSSSRTRCASCSSLPHCSSWPTLLCPDNNEANNEDDSTISVDVAQQVRPLPTSSVDAISCSDLKPLLLNHLKTHIRQVSDYLLEATEESSTEEPVISRAMSSCSWREEASTVLLDATSQEEEEDLDEFLSKEQCSLTIENRPYASTLSLSSSSSMSNDLETFPQPSLLASGDRPFIIPQRPPTPPSPPVPHVLPVPNEVLATLKRENEAASTDTNLLKVTSQEVPFASRARQLMTEVRMRMLQPPLTTRHEVPGRKIRELLRKLQKNSNSTGGPWVMHEESSLTAAAAVDFDSSGRHRDDVGRHYFENNRRKFE